MLKTVRSASVAFVRFVFLCNYGTCLCNLWYVLVFGVIFMYIILLVILTVFMYSLLNKSA